MWPPLAETPMPILVICIDLFSLFFYYRKRSLKKRFFLRLKGLKRLKMVLKIVPWFDIFSPDFGWKPPVVPWFPWLKKVFKFSLISLIGLNPGFFCQGSIKLCRKVATAFIFVKKILQLLDLILYLFSVQLVQPFRTGFIWFSVYIF